MKTEGALEGLPTPGQLKAGTSKRYRRYTQSSLYLTMRDGVKIAIDLHLPKGLAAGVRIPTIVRQTWYGRSWQFRWPLDRFFGGSHMHLYEKTRKTFLAHGYAWLDVDVRGSGASYGTRLCPWSPDEVQDGVELVDWIIKQPWSNGNVGAMGISYDGTAAEFLLVNRHPAVKAVAPRFASFDLYADLVFPGGVHQNWLTDTMTRLVGALDRGAFDESTSLWARAFMEGARTSATDQNRPILKRIIHLLDREGFYKLVGLFTKLFIKGVRPVDADRDRSMLAGAIEDHSQNINIHEGALEATHRDDTSLAPAIPDRNIDIQDKSIDFFSPHTYVEDIEASGAAIYSYSGWWDVAFQYAAIKRYLTLNNPGSRLIIGPWEHGDRWNISPFGKTRKSRFDHDAELLKFFERHLKAVGNGATGEKPIRYFTMGEERWRSTDKWPPDARMVTYHLAEGRVLFADKPTADEGYDDYLVDFTAGTGRRSRWTSALSIEGRYPPRDKRDEKLLTYTSPPLGEELEVTGHPIVTLYVSSTATDGAFFAYMEDVDAKGRVTYVTEGQLRAVHRKLSDDEPPYRHVVPYRSFKREDAEPLVPGEVAELVFDLLPTSYLFKEGHSIRIALAGADCDHFALIPPGDPPTVRFYRSSEASSRVDLPVISRDQCS